MKIRSAHAVELRGCANCRAAHILLLDEDDLPFAEGQVAVEDIPAFIKALQDLAYTIVTHSEEKLQ